ncbi:signal peptidase I [Candidatus Woesearchaeota archaeon]|nr:signal peptidase I [Candidatus Woesearchaeota archaeon]
MITNRWVRTLLLAILLVSAGWLLHGIVPAQAAQTVVETARQAGQYFNEPPEQPSPKERISRDKILVYDDKVVIEMPNVVWAMFTDTNSMDPVIDQGSYALEIAPQSPAEIQPGDIISYKSPFVSGNVIHRVIETGNDGEWYAVAKGDNNPSPDPGRIRFSQINRVVVAIIY